MDPLSAGLCGSVAQFKQKIQSSEVFLLRVCSAAFPLVLPSVHVSIFVCSHWKFFEDSAFLEGGPQRDFQPLIPYKLPHLLQVNIGRLTLDVAKPRDSVSAVLIVNNCLSCFNIANLSLH